MAEPPEVIVDIGPPIFPVTDPEYTGPEQIDEETEVAAIDLNQAPPSSDESRQRRSLW